MKILFVDIDGTIIENNVLINQKDPIMLRKLKDTENLVVFTTGRNYKGAMSCLNKYDLPYDFLILCNGAQIRDEQGEIVINQAIKKSVGREIIAHCMSQIGVRVFIYTGYETVGYCDGKTLIPSPKGFINTDKYDFTKEYLDMNEFLSISLHQENLEMDKLMEIKKCIDDKFGEYVNSYFNKQNLDITLKGCNKGTGIDKLKDYIQCESITYGIGDDHNDITMFEAVDYSYTFNRVDEKIAKHAQKRVDYVFEIIEEMLNKNSIRGEEK